ncbi:hypothetical protein Peur_028786 [Populus x canadensis]
MTESTKLKRFVYINDDESQPTRDLFCDNRISNRKYTPLNFLPKNLMEQFRLQLIAAAGMVPIRAIKYFRYTYKPSKINTLQQAERLDVAPVSITQSKNINPVYEPLLSDSPSSRRLLGSGTPFDFFQSQSRLSSIYSRNWKDNRVLGDVHCDKHTFRCHS